MKAARAAWSVKKAVRTRAPKQEAAFIKSNILAAKIFQADPEKYGGAMATWAGMVTKKYGGEEYGGAPDCERDGQLLLLPRGEAGRGVA